MNLNYININYTFEYIFFGESKANLISIDDS